MKGRSVLRGLIVGVIVTVVGCGPPYKPTQTSDDFKGSWAKAIKQLEARTSHDLNCPLEQLTFKDLGGFDFGGSPKVGVSGCDARATYIYDITGKLGWVADIAASN